MLLGNLHFAWSWSRCQRNKSSRDDSITLRSILQPYCCCMDAFEVTDTLFSFIDLMQSTANVRDRILQGWCWYECNIYFQLFSLGICRRSWVRHSFPFTRTILFRRLFKNISIFVHDFVRSWWAFAGIEKCKSCFVPFRAMLQTCGNFCTGTTSER